MTRFKKFTSILASTTMLLSSTMIFNPFTAAAEEDFASYGLGDENITIAEEEAFLDTLGSANDEAFEDVTVLTSVDLSETNYFPPIGNQGSLGSCASWATTYYQFTYEANKLKNITTNASNAYSPSYTFNLLNGGVNAGVSAVYAYDVLKNQGAMKMNVCPYDASNFNYNWDYTVQNQINALKTRLTGHGELVVTTSSTSKITSCTDTDLDEVKKALCYGKVLMIRVQAGSGMSNWSFKSTNSGDGVAAYRASSAGGGHAMVVVGYDDTVTCDINGNGTIEASERGAFKIANSWGTGWKNDGFVWLMYDALNVVSANTTNSWEDSESGTRIPAFQRTSGSGNKFHYIDVDNKIINLVGALNVDIPRRYGLKISTGKTAASDVMFYLAQGNLSNKIASHSGSIVVDYADCDTDILSSLTSNWYVKIQNLSSVKQSCSYTYSILDDRANVVKNFGQISTGIVSGGTAQANRQITLREGDVNYDGIIDSNDYDMVSGSLTYLTTLSTLQKNLGDVNHDGQIMINDAIAIMQMYD